MGFEEYGSLPDAEKKRLCLGLLQEFGVRNLREANDELIHSCPLPFGLHRNGDQNPSASLNYRKLVFRCLGCGAKGGLLWFIGTMRGTSGTDARQWLGNQTGIGGVQDIGTLLGFLDALDSPDSLTPTPIPEYDPRMLEPWKLIHPYLTEVRHISEANVMKHTVGWDGQSIVIPHFWKGKLVGWQARRLVQSSGPKYKSTPEFPRDRTLFNYDPSAERAVIVESPMSVVARTHQCHLEATFGAAVTTKQCDLIVQHPEIVLFFDNDEAGWTATRTVGEHAMNYTSRLWAIDNPYAADPADLDDATFTRLLTEHAVPWVLWQPPRELLAYERSDGWASSSTQPEI